MPSSQAWRVVMTGDHSGARRIDPVAVWEALTRLPPAGEGQASRSNRVELLHNLVLATGKAAQSLIEGCSPAAVHSNGSYRAIRKNEML
jgi:hypothetical protein